VGAGPGTIRCVVPTATVPLLRHGSGDRGYPPSRFPDRMRWLAVPAGFLAGSVPVANLAARLAAGVDLRTVGNGTVSGTALYDVAGFKVLAVAGILEVAKGAVGPLIAGRDDVARCALAAAAGVSGHNWSPWIGGAGGRGVSPAIGALAVAAPAGSATLLSGLVAGRLAGETAIGSLVADAVLVPVCVRLHGRRAAPVAAAILVPMLLKRLAGNGPAAGGPQVYLWRLLFDRDQRAAPGGGRRSVRRVLRRSVRWRPAAPGGVPV
jgi:glycerol-3-phosphate acyltransferase PlsY